jgi:PhoPQ-activated pathogenicity-related protein
MRNFLRSYRQSSPVLARWQTVFAHAVLALALTGLVGCRPPVTAPDSPSTPTPAAATNAGSQTALDRYVAAPDATYRYSLLKTTPTPVGNVYVLEMTSQTWLTPAEVDRPVWTHWLSLAVPPNVTNPIALLFISGGSNDKGPPKGPDGNLARIALATKSVVAELRCVPNQPLTFHNDGKPRHEDDLIAYTWDQFLRTGDERWPARLPMTKAAVRAMDTVSDFCAKPEGGGAKISKFVVAGASKRGWTTWATAAVDPRVVGIAPIVIDVLNVVPSMQHHYAAYGFFAPAVGNYTSQGIMDWMDTPEFQALMRIEDPFSYRDRLTMPKLLINACGDQFFLPDSAQFYFDQLPGEKYLRYVPNADHSLKETDAIETLEAFHSALLTGTPLPRFEWKFAADGSVQVKTTDAPQTVKLWQATNPRARDFRLETFGPQWTSTPLTATAGDYTARVPAPPAGWTAYMVELTFPRPGTKPLKLTTPVRVVPDRLDHKFTPKTRVKTPATK